MECPPSGSSRTQRRRGGRPYPRSRVAQGEYRKAGFVPRYVKKQVKYSLDEVLAVRLDPVSLDTSSIPASVLSRQVQLPISKWRLESSWSEQVRKTSDHQTRLFKSLLNKLAPKNAASIYAKLLEQVTEETSACLAQLLLEKGIGELKFGECYAQVCCDLGTARPYFKRQFLTACQVLFEGIMEECPEHKRMLAIVNFVSQLFTNKVIPLKILKSCCDDFVSKGTEEYLEALCHLLGGCGWAFSHPRFKSKAHLYLEGLKKQQETLSSRLKFKVQDLIETQGLKVLYNQRIS